MNQDPMGGQIPPTPMDQAPSANPTPASSWAPAPATPSNDLMGQMPANTAAPTPPPAAPVSNPFETTPPPVSPVSGPTAPLNNQPMMEPAGPKSNAVLIIALVILLVVGGLVMASWLGWINLGGLEKIWGGGKTATVTPITNNAPDTTPAVTNNNANDLQRKTDLANIKAALKEYFAANQSYPVAATTEKTIDSAALKVLVPDYIAALPLDPLTPTNYYGYKSADGQTFELTCVLEDTTDPKGITTGSVFLYRITDATNETTATTPAATPGTTVLPDASSDETIITP